MKKAVLLIALPALLASISAPSERPGVLKHVSVYKEAGRYGGWPANHGIWSWGNEIVVGFSGADFLWNDEDRHPYDRSKPEEPWLARSLDGGETWSAGAPPSLRAPFQGGPPALEPAERMDFGHPDFAMTLRFKDAQTGPSFLFYSYDRGKTWRGPFNFPSFGQVAIAARTDYIINGRRDAFVFVTAAKPIGREGRVLCARTLDGGMTWQFVAWIGPEPKNGFSIMPSSVRLSQSEILTTFRHEENFRRGPNWIEAWRSLDNGATWEFLNRVVPDTGAKSGNPPSLVRLKEGRLALTWGFRSEPYSIRARISDDNGRTWSDDIVLRDGGAGWDVGYTRSVERPDGRIVTVYYWCRDAKKERTIEATIWDPGKRAGRPARAASIKGVR